MGTRDIYRAIGALGSVGVILYADFPECPSFAVHAALQQGGQGRSGQGAVRFGAQRLLGGTE